MHVIECFSPHPEENKCTDQQFRCPTGRCIPKEWLCDGDGDCAGEEDERVGNDTNCGKFIGPNFIPFM